MRNTAKKTALGGMTAALAVVIMCMGGLIPVATFVCPMMCMMMLWMTAKVSGRRIGWAWYGAVAMLGLMLSPDKESAAVFLCLGFYPLVKPYLDRLPFSFLWKLLLFNVIIAIMYAVMIRLLGMDQIASEYTGLGVAMTVILLILGNITFLLLDLVFSRMSRRKRK